MRKIFFLIITLFLTLFITNSCASKQTLLNKESLLRLETLPSKTHNITVNNMYLEDGEFVIYGKIEQYSGICNSPGHVDLAILKDDKTILKQLNLTHRSPGSKARRRGGWFGADFRTRFPLEMQKNTTIRLKYHAFNCYIESDEKCKKELGLQ